MSIKKIITNCAFFAYALVFVLAGCKSEEERVTPVKPKPVPTSRVPKEECIAGPIVTVPDGGEAFLRGNTIDIKWYVSCVDNFTSVKIELYRGSVLSNVLASSTPHDGSFLWTIPGTFTIGDTYNVKISAIGASNYDFSNSYFTITDNVSNWLQSPNGGQTITNNTSVTVSWNKWLVPTTANSIQLELYKGTAMICSLSSNIANDGTESVFIPTYVAPGSDYRVKISNTATNSTNYSDFSNSYFSVANFTNTSQWVLLPNGGESIRNNTAFTVRWDTGLVKSRKVNIEVLRMDNGSRRTLASNYTDTGSFNWYVAEDMAFVQSVSCKIRIIDAENSALVDESNNWFQVTLF